MADNVTLPGTGTVVAADDVSSVWYQRVKLVDGTADSTAAIPGSATDGLLVNLGTNNDVTVTGTVTVGSHAVTNAGTFAVQVDGNALTALQLIDNTVLVDDNAFTPATSSVNAVGFMADETSTDLVDEGDIGAARMTLDRKQIVVLGDIAAGQVLGGGSKTDTSDQSIMAASGSASVFNYLCWVAVYNSSSTNTYVNVKDGSTVRLVLPLPAYGGAVFNLPYPIKGTGNTAWNLAAGASVTTAYLYGGGYKGA